MLESNLRARSKRGPAEAAAPQRRTGSRPPAASTRPQPAAEQRAAKKLHPNPGSNSNDAAGALAQQDCFSRDCDNDPRPDCIADTYNGAVKNGQPTILIDENGVDPRQRFVRWRGRRRRLRWGSGSCIGWKPRRLLRQDGG